MHGLQVGLMICSNNLKEKTTSLLHRSIVGTFTAALQCAAVSALICLLCFQILSDTKELQKEINNLTGKLDRTFAVTDELVFKVTQDFQCKCPRLSVHMSICPHFCLSTCPSVHISICICLSICSSLHMSLCPRLSVHMSVRPHVCLTICLSDRHVVRSMTICR